MGKAKPVTYLAWGIEVGGKGTRELHGVAGYDRPDIIEARNHARQFLRQDKARGQLPSAARVVRIRVTVEVA